MSPKIERPLAHRVKLRTERVEPAWMKFRTDIALDNLAKDRTLTLLPSLVNWITLNFKQLPAAAKPRTLKLLPQRAKLRMLKVEPMLA